MCQAIAGFSDAGSIKSEAMLVLEGDMDARRVLAVGG
jgi:hypothetical protein